MGNVAVFTTEACRQGQGYRQYTSVLAAHKEGDEIGTGFSDQGDAVTGLEAHSHEFATNKLSAVTHLCPGNRIGQVTAGIIEICTTLTFCRVLNRFYERIKIRIPPLERGILCRRLYLHTVGFNHNCPGLL